MTGEKLGTEMANEMPIWALIIHVRCVTMNNSKSNLYPQDLLSDVKMYKSFRRSNYIYSWLFWYEDILLLMFIFFSFDCFVYYTNSSASGRLLHNRFDYSSNISSSSSRRRSSSSSISKRLILLILQTSSCANIISSLIKMRCYFICKSFMMVMFMREREREEKRASEREGERENKRLAYARAHLGCRLETIWLITMQKAAKITLARLAHCSGMIDGFPLNMQQRADGKRNFSELSNG
ncbi:hypothetical protein T10_361 [Trichinella papuae]|uniref:Uncharacterized protein n=1 Tax=Trichinella papuae TaxID=268474 RepID=A0A0V1MNB6_9BILA|nr:hypothetical protein T10_361 [Trichinella papuae]